VRIVHVIDHFQPWMGYQETYLAREQQKLGHEVLVVASCRYTRAARAIASEQPLKPGLSNEHGIPVYRLPVYFEVGTRAAYVWLKGLSQVLSHFTPDVVHGHGALSFTCFQAAVLKKQFGYRLILDTHMADFNVHPPDEPWNRTMIKRLSYKAFVHTFGRAIAREADSLVAIGEPERDFVMRLFGSRLSEVPVIHLGADDEVFRFSAADRARLRREFGWRDDDLVLGHVGTLRPSKEIETLLDACAILGSEFSQIKILLVGSIDTAYLERLQQLIAAHGLVDRVIFQGFTQVHMLPGYFSAMDIAVWPGDISNAAIEAMSVGLPVIACRSSYTQAIIERYRAGVLFDRSNPHDLAQALMPLVCDRALRDTYAARARAAVERDLNWRSIALQFLDLYTTMLKKR
jgi:glycosyltransferase involved in cell wall biosynthesis